MLRRSTISNTNSAARVLYSFLFLYVIVAGTYQIITSVSLTIEVFNLRNQVTAPFQIGQRQPVITGLTERAKRAGLSVGDTVQSVNENSYNGYALWQRTRWDAHPGESVRVGVRKPNGRHSTATVLLTGYPKGASASVVLQN